MDEEGFPFLPNRASSPSPSPSVESLASAHTRASYSHDYASDDYESDDVVNDNGDRDGNNGPSTASHTSSSSSSFSGDSSPSSQQPRRPNLASQRFATSSNSSIQNFFGPPFYGRPPTPLPPSPSLTSLLRPSRPTTPDGSDDDAAHVHGSFGADYRGGPIQPNQQAVAQDPVRKSSPRVPTYEYYGFILYMFATLSFGLYLLWAFLPSPFLHALGIYYYPNRWWALAVPSFLVACVVYIYVALAAYNTEMLTVRMAAVEAMVDGAANIAVIDCKGRIRGQDRRRRPDNGVDLRKSGARGSVMLDWKRVWGEGTDAVMDIPLAGVCEVLYGDGH